MKHIRILTALAVPMIALTLSAYALRAGTTDDKNAQDKPAPAKPVEGADKAKGAAVGQPAPAFTLKDLDGKTVKLSDFKDKIVVLEWFNPECPVVAACHSKGDLKTQADRVTKDGIVWLAINSSAAGKEGSDLDKNKKMREEWKMKYPVLLDASGEVGRAYGAKTTPAMYVIDAKGVLVYRGAIDSAQQNKAEGDKVINYVDAALADMKAGKPVAVKETKSYGCGVKYANPGS